MALVRVSSARITSTACSTSNARSVMSRRLPIGVGTKYNAVEGDKLDGEESVCSITVTCRGLDLNQAFSQRISKYSMTGLANNF